jgi:two-component system chemotaxis response regulator CheB
MSARDHDHRSVIAKDLEKQEQGGKSDEPSTYSCPDCGGVLWQFDERGIPRFACHIGHEWTADALVVAKSRALEQAIHEAIRGLKEKATLLRQLALRANPVSPTTAHLIEQADQDEEHARLLRSHLLDEKPEVESSIDTTEDVIAAFVREMRRAADD